MVWCEPKSNDVHVKRDDKETLKQNCKNETEPETDDLPSSRDTPVKMKVEQVHLGLKDNDGNVSSTKIMKSNQTKNKLDIDKNEYKKYSDNNLRGYPEKYQWHLWMEEHV